MKQGHFWKNLWGRAHASARFGRWLTAILASAVVVFNLVFFGLANKLSLYFSDSQVYAHTLSGNTDAYLGEVADRGDVEIIFCNHEENITGEPAYNLVYQTALQMAERYGFVKTRIVNIFTDPEQVEPYKYATDPDTGEREKINDINRNSVIVAAEGDFVVLSMQHFFVLDSDNVITAYSGEEIMAAMIHRVQTEVRPTAYFTTQHGETYSSSFYNRLLCAGYDIATVDLVTEELGAGAGDLLVISNPRYDFSVGAADKGITGELDKIDAFLARGGSLFAMLDPLVTNTVFLERMLAEWGIELWREETDGMRESVMIRDNTNSITTDGYALICDVAGSALAETLAAELSEVEAGRVIVRQASPMLLEGKEGKTVSAILTTSSSSHAYAGGKEVSGDGQFAVAAASRDGASGGSVFAVASVYMTAQDAITTNEYGNRDLILSLVGNLTGASVPTGCSYFILEPTVLEDLTMREARLWTVLVAVAVPCALLVAGACVMLKRRYR